MMVAGTVARRERAADAAVSAGLSAAAYKPAKPANLLRLSNAARALVTAPRSLHDPVRVSCFLLLKLSLSHTLLRVTFRH